MAFYSLSLMRKNKGGEGSRSIDWVPMVADLRHAPLTFEIVYYLHSRWLPQFRARDVARVTVHRPLQAAKQSGRSRP